MFERRWALTVLAHALARLRQEHVLGGREHEFEALKPYLTGEEPKTPYRQVAVELGMTS